MSKATESNYDKMGRQAAALFMQCDQAEMIRRWDLEADEDFLYIPYFDREPVLRVDRKTGAVSYTAAYLGAHPEIRAEDSQLNYTAMIVYDLLTYAGERPRAAGRWASISSLGGIIGAGHETTLQPRETLAFTGKTRALAQACRRLGGQPMQQGDVSFSFRVFRDFQIWFQFWDADEDFPAAIKYLFDENALQYMHYETLWYVMGDLVGRIQAEMERAACEEEQDAADRNVSQ